MLQNQVICRIFWILTVILSFFPNFFFAYSKKKIYTFVTTTTPVLFSPNKKSNGKYTFFFCQNKEEETALRIMIKQTFVLGLVDVWSSSVKVFYIVRVQKWNKIKI